MAIQRPAFESPDCLRPSGGECCPCLEGLRSWAASSGSCAPVSWLAGWPATSAYGKESSRLERSVHHENTLLILLLILLRHKYACHAYVYVCKYVCHAYVTNYCRWLCLHLSFEMRLFLLDVPGRRSMTSLLCVCVGCVCHSCVPVRDAGHPAGQGLDSTWSLAGCGLLPETRLQPPHTPAGTTVVVHTHGLLNTNIRNTLHNYTHFRDYPNTTFSKHRSDVQLIKVPSTRAKTIFSPPFSFDAFREYFRKNTVVYRVAKSCPFHWSPWDP